MATQTELETGSHIYNPFVTPLPIRPAIIKTRQSSNYTPFLARPLLGALLFPVESSDARDHCANERTFLSWLRLAVYLAVVGVAITVSFHLKNQPSALEVKVALPLGTLFWVLSLVCLGAGLSNYIVTVTRYGQRRAIVQTGWKTQMVCILSVLVSGHDQADHYKVFTVISTTIVGCCALFLAVDTRAR